MHTLPEPAWLKFSCSDRTGKSVTAEVFATHESDNEPWVWRAVFRDTGEPPAELMGASETANGIRMDVRARVSQLEMARIVVPSLEDRTADGDASVVAAVNEMLRSANATDDSRQRRDNLVAVRRELRADGVAGLGLAAKLIGCSESALKQILDGDCPMSDGVAREIEWALQKPRGCPPGCSSAASYPRALAVSRTACFARKCHCPSIDAVHPLPAWAKNGTPLGLDFGTAGTSQQGISSSPSR